MRIKLPKTRARLAGPGTRLYADPKPSPDETSFQIDNTSAQYYNSPYYLAHKDQVQPFPAPRTGVPAYLDLQDFVPTEVLDAINTTGRITFHAVGDTGAAKGVPATAIANEAGVADAMAADVQSGGVTGPAFFFHLGDVIYNFGEAQYYYDQFYEPFRDYDRPIFAIPGNHDGMLFGATSATPQVANAGGVPAKLLRRRSRAFPGFGRPGTHGDDAAGGLFHSGRALRFDHRPLQQRAGFGRGSDFVAGRQVSSCWERSIGILAERTQALEAGSSGGKARHYYCGSPSSGVGRCQARRLGRR